MNLRVILILWIVAIAVLLFSQYNSYLRTTTWFQKSLADRHLLMVLFSGLLVFHMSISPFINEQNINHRRKL
jgi:hypothetical protein